MNLNLNNIIKKYIYKLHYQLPLISIFKSPFLLLYYSYAKSKCFLVRSLSYYLGFLNAPY